MSHDEGGGTLQNESPDALDDANSSGISLKRETLLVKAEIDAAEEHARTLNENVSHALVKFGLFPPIAEPHQ